MGDLACVNGELMAPEQATIPIYDRGFLFGDSVYEVCRIYRGRCWLEAEHLDRLKRSLNELEFPAVDFDRLTERIHRTIRASFVEEGLVYLQITRGVAPRSHLFPNPPVPPTEVIIVRPYDDSSSAALRKSGASVVTRPDIRWKRCDIKSTNLLGNVLALESAHREGAFEAVLVDPEGYVTEATHTSLLWVRDGRIEATPETHAILIGMTRHLVQRLAAKLGVPFVETRATLDEVQSSDEAFLVGTTAEVIPITTIDGRNVGSGHPGPITSRIQEAYVEELNTWLAESAATATSRNASATAS